MTNGMIVLFIRWPSVTKQDSAWFRRWRFQTTKI